MIIKELFLFGMVGVVGFLVDASVLYLLKDSLGVYGARIPSFILAVFTTWLLNRGLTFGHKYSGIVVWREFLRYLGLMLGGGLVNYATYAGLVAWLDVVRQHPVLGVAAGSIAGMAINYLSSRFLVFRKMR